MFYSSLGQKNAHSKYENSMNDVPEDGNSSPVGRYLGLAAGVPVGLILVAVVSVVGVLMYKKRKDKRSGPPANDDHKASAVQFI